MIFILQISIKLFDERVLCNFYLTKFTLTQTT